MDKKEKEILTRKEAYEDAENVEEEEMDLACSPEFTEGCKEVSDEQPDEGQKD